MNSTEIRTKFDDLNCCVIIPTYNNGPKLEAVLVDVFQYTNKVIVVNDGSTDTTSDILSQFEHAFLIIHHVEENQGKGNALRIGFKLAQEQGFSYAITIDSDGQHLAKDFEPFLDKIDQEPNALIVGARNMESAAGIPKKSSFGHKNSNFWYMLETGQTLPDTQSGFRLYPLSFIKNTQFFSKKFGFEVEVIVKAAWKGVNVTYVPITVLYPKDRITHFKPVEDFTRVSITNAVLVFLALTYYRPILFVKKLRKKNLKQIWEDLIWVKNESTLKKSISVAYGVFCGLSPFWGFHTGMAIGGALLFRLNKALTIFASNVSFPPFIPLVLYLSLQTGTIVLNEPFIEFHDLWELNFDAIKHNSYTYFVGSMVLSIGLAISSGAISYFLISKKTKSNG